jgi:hypothetical protein
MVILMILFGVGLLPIAVFWLLPRSSRKGAAYSLIVIGVAALLAATSLVVAVNKGWVTP